MSKEITYASKTVGMMLALPKTITVAGKEQDVHERVKAMNSDGSSLVKLSANNDSSIKVSDPVVQAAIEADPRFAKGIIFVVPSAEDLKRERALAAAADYRQNLANQIFDGLFEVEKLKPEALKKTAKRAGVEILTEEGKALTTKQIIAALEDALPDPEVDEDEYEDEA